jgi:hypothetical protein
VDDLDKFEVQRYKARRGLRLIHYADIETLILKVPKPAHEVVTGTFGDHMLVKQFLQMGVPVKGLGTYWFNEICGSFDVQGSRLIL